MIEQAMVAMTDRRFNHVEAKYRNLKAPSTGANHHIGVKFSKTSCGVAKAQ
jgi:hypothetical protein